MVSIDLASRLRNRVTFQRSTDTERKGGYTTTWQPLGTRWAEVISQNGREAVIAGALQGISAYKITIRAGFQVKASDQVVLADGTVLNIKSVAPDPFMPREATVMLADSSSVQA